MFAVWFFSLSLPFFLTLCLTVKGSRPGKNVQLTENEIRGLCLKSREIFLSQPILLELEAPLKICGEGLVVFFLSGEFTCVVVQHLQTRYMADVAYRGGLTHGGLTWCCAFSKLLKATLYFKKRERKLLQNSCLNSRASVWLWPCVFIAQLEGETDNVGLFCTQVSWSCFPVSSCWSHSAVIIISFQTHTHTLKCRVVHLFTGPSSASVSTSDCTFWFSPPPAPLSFVVVCVHKARDDGIFCDC